MSEQVAKTSFWEAKRKPSPTTCIASSGNPTFAYALIFGSGFVYFSVNGFLYSSRRERHPRHYEFVARKDCGPYVR